MTQVNTNNLALTTNDINKTAFTTNSTNEHKLISEGCGFDKLK